MSEDLSVVKNKVDNSLPLTREEMAVYFTCLTQTVKTFADVLQERQDRQNEQMKSILEAQQELQKEFFNRTDRLLAENAKSQRDYFNSALETLKTASVRETPRNPVFRNSLDKDRTKEWVRDAYYHVTALASPMKKCKSRVLGYIYGAMFDDKSDLDKLFEEYKSFSPKTAKINMISESDELRGKFDRIVSGLEKTYLNPPSKEADVLRFKSVEIRRVPDEIYEAAKPVLYNYKTDILALRAIYKKMESLTGIDLDEMSARYAASIGYKGCNKGYMISHSEPMMRLFRAAVGHLKLERKESA